MGSISIDQWRGRIGAFAAGFNASETKVSKTSKLRSFCIVGTILLTGNISICLYFLKIVNWTNI